MKENFNYPSTNKRTNIKASQWIPDNEPKAILQIVHGMVEFIDRYDGFASYLNQQDILVVGHDHLGHGESVNHESEWGYFAKEESADILVEDVESLRKITAEKYPELPYFILGHSMGSFVTRNYLLKHSESIDGVIICGTGQNPLIQLKSAKILTRTLAQFRGWRHRSKLIDKLAFGGMNRQFEPARTTSDWLTRDEEIVDFYNHEPRCQFIFTLNGYETLFDLCIKMQDKEKLSLMRKDLPVLFIAGDKDPVGKNGQYIHDVVSDFNEVLSQPAEWILYPDYRHEILNEIGKEQVYHDVSEWITKQL
ncbi:alpha/beta fold hydrolase [Erysipelothrix urinaevulpis]|uniref:alpha/beta fold hydrolase n=1 Tax=Erysipelothrix urinaevulpis TaxID=2683717 RepID=UPI0013570F12|nr:alpha/beta fold hydrolase [Erysipelothrix urinaevulpis]